MLSRLSFFLALTLLCSCTHTTIALVDPTYRDSSVGYVCHGAACKPSSTLVPGTDEHFGMVNVMLPAECQTKFVRLVVHEAGSSNPSVEVWCAP